MPTFTTLGVMSVMPKMQTPMRIIQRRMRVVSLISTFAILALMFLSLLFGALAQSFYGVFFINLYSCLMLFTIALVCRDTTASLASSSQVSEITRLAESGTCLAVMDGFSIAAGIICTLFNGLYYVPSFVYMENFQAHMEMSIFASVLAGLLVITNCVVWVYIDIVCYRTCGKVLRGEVQRKYF